MNGEVQKMSCAMKVNDVYIEDIIKDYITLGVSGRYDTNAEIESYDLSDDGAVYESHRVKSKTLTVYFVVRSKTKSELRKALNALNGIFRAEQMRLSFDDEPGLFYVGTRATIKYDKILDCDAKGKISIYCADPHKYSIEEFEEFADQDGTITVDYNGTVPFAPVLTAVMNSDVGGVSFANTAGTASVIVGELEQADGEIVKIPETLKNSNFVSKHEIDGWTQGSETTIPTVDNGGIYEITGQNYLDDVGLHADYGSGTVWHGPNYQLVIPPDSNGEYGASYFSCIMGVNFAQKTTNGNDRGRLYIQFNTGNETDGYAAVFRAELYKSTRSSKTAEIRLLDEHTNVLKTLSVDMSSGALSDTTLYISKLGKTLLISSTGGSISVDVPAIENSSVTQVELVLAAFASNAALTNEIKTFKFTKYNVESWHDLPNTLSTGDIVKVDCEDYTIKINEVSQPKYGDINNDFDGMQLLPGYNAIKCTTNAWVSNAPKFGIKYREVFI